MVWMAAGRWDHTTAITAAWVGKAAVNPYRAGDDSDDDTPVLSDEENAVRMMAMLDGAFGYTGPK